MSYSPLISIQIPTYNQKNYIKDALNSALAQSYDNLQVIVSDDCSSEYDIFDYLDEYRNNPKVLIHRNEENVGRVANYRNTLYNLVEGEWFINLDGDDYFTCDFLNEVVEFLKYNNIVCIEFDHKINIIADVISETKLINDSHLLINGLDYLYAHSSYKKFAHANCIFSTVIAKNVNFYNDNLLAADFFSALKIYLQGNIILSEKKIMHWREHSENATKSLTLQNIENEYLGVSNFKGYAEKILRKKKLEIITSELYFDLFRRGINIYLERKLDKSFIKFLLSKVKLNKKYLRYIILFLREKL